MYTIISINAVVLELRERSESSAVIVLFSDELGKLFVHAQGIRKLAAKHASTMQLGARVQVDMVRGKHEWRLVGSTMLAPSVLASEADRMRFGRLAQVVRDLTAVEDPHPTVFQALAESAQLTAKPSRRLLEEVSELGQVVEALGWWVDPVPLADYIEGVQPLRQFVQAVNKGLTEAYS